MAGVPLLLWKLLEEIEPGDRVLVSRLRGASSTELSDADRETALLLGAFVSEGFVSETRAGFNNIDHDFFDVGACCLRRGGRWRRYVYDRTIASGSRLFELDVQNFATLPQVAARPLIGLDARNKTIPEWVWRGPRLPSASSCRRSSPVTVRRRCCPARRCRSRTRPTASSSRRTCSCCCSSSASSAVSAGTQRARSRSCSRIAAMHACSPATSGSSERSRRSSTASWPRCRVRAARSRATMSRSSRATSAPTAGRAGSRRTGCAGTTSTGSSGGSRAAPPSSSASPRTR